MSKNTLVCENCGTKWDFSDEDYYYHRMGGLIQSGVLKKCRACMEKAICFTAEPFSRVIPVPSFGLDAMYSPLNAQIIVEIHPVNTGKEKNNIEGGSK